MKLSDITAQVLIIDDDPDVRNAVRMTLESEQHASYTFAEADSVAAGLEALQSTETNVVILDLHLPGEDGFEFMDKVKADESLSLAKVIVLTADDSSKNLWKAMNRGIDAYQFVGKPFVNDELRALVLNLALPA